MFAFVSSIIAGLFLALFAYMSGLPGVMLALAVISGLAYMSHETGLPLLVRQVAHFSGLILAIATALYCLNSFIS